MVPGAWERYHLAMLQIGIPAILLVIAGVSACDDGGPGESDVGTDADGDTDADADGDVDGDADGDLETDGDPDGDGESDGDIEPAPGVVFVTVAGHLEDNPVYASCEAYPSFRNQLLTFADSIASSGIAFNLQIEYEFLSGARNCETTDMQETTDGLNVVDYLATHHGFEIDAHQEGGWEEGRDNYADVRHLAGLVTPTGVSEVVGGFKWDDPAQIATLATGEEGWLFPDFTWHPEVLTLAVGYEHHLGDFDDDDLTSGVWFPAGGDGEFLTHDADGHLAYVGPGLHHQNWSGGRNCFFASALDYIEVLLDYMERGEIESDRIYTVSIPLPQSMMLQRENHATVLERFEELEPLVEAGLVRYATYSEVVEIWREDYGSQPNIFTFDNIDPADYTCR